MSEEIKQLWTEEISKLLWKQALRNRGMSFIIHDAHLVLFIRKYDVRLCSGFICFGIDPLAGFLKQRIEYLGSITKEVFVDQPGNCHLIKTETVVWSL
jgi:hypothetical protein